MHLLLIASSAPPKNSPEAMQVGRFLEALDPAVRVTLVTTPVERGWVREDGSLAVSRAGIRVIRAGLPWHAPSQRVLGNRRLARLHRPDALFWLPALSGWVARQLPEVPDVVYSRSGSFSDALLARRLKRALGRPWLMHLSDPWSGSPYRRFRSDRAAEADRALEAACFAEADAITLTTEGQAAYYRARYPARADRISVTPNMMPLHPETPPAERRPGPVRLVYTGAFYGERSPSTLLRAVEILGQEAPETLERLEVHVYGNAPPEVAAAISATPRCTHHGPVTHDVARRVQADADVLMSIEPDGAHPLLPHFLLSKIVDYLSTGKPILALTPEGSETERLCRITGGWAVTPGDVPGLSKKLAMIAAAPGKARTETVAPPGFLGKYSPEVVSGAIEGVLQDVLEGARAAATQ